MPQATKRLDNLAKHLTKDEIESRKNAEEKMLPSRANLKRPKTLAKDPVAIRLWNKVLKDMEGYEILDILDADVLAVYCSMVSRREDMVDRYRGLREGYEASEDLNAKKEWHDAMRDLNKDIQGLEKLILQYAGTLGLTPDGRARLAKKAAEQEAAGEDDDLFA